LVFQPVNGGAYFATQELSLDAVDFNTLIIRITTEREGPATIYFATSYDPQFNPSKSVSFFIRHGAHDYILNLAAHNQHWAGSIKGLAMTPGPQGTTLVIRSAEITKGHFLTNIRAGWKEFWAEEAIVGRTVNIITGQTIFGQPVTYYLYAIIGLAFIVLLIITPGNYLSRTRASLSQVIIVSLILFALLEGRMWFDYSRLAIADAQSLWGRSLAAKRELVTGGGLYTFVLFCQQAIPPSAEVEFAAPGDYYSSKGAYYIYPHRVKTGAPYLIVFHGNLDRSQVNNYVKFTQFKEGEFILKKK